MRLGIDFGTTHSVVAYADRGNYPVVNFYSEAGDALDWYPSLIAERDGELRYGFQAAKLCHESDWAMLRSFKRLLSDTECSPDTLVTLGQSQIPLLELLAGFLGSLREDLVHHSNVRGHIEDGETFQAVVAVPANAHSTQRFLTLEAFRRAGFEVTALLNEPSAAGFEYTHRYRSTLTSRREHVLVYDLGGGTFDASLVRMSGQQHNVVATSGLTRLGGDDFDAELMKLVLAEARIPERRLEPPRRCMLLEQCRIAKEELHPQSRRMVIDLEVALGPDYAGAHVAIAVSDFYDACQPIVDRTLQAMVPVLSRADADGAGGEEGRLAEVAGIYVVGGASALPLVSRVLNTHYGRRVHRSPYPASATAIGLAIAADPEAGFQLTDRFSRVFGVFREARDGARVSFDPIFTREVCLPRDADGRTEAFRHYHSVHNVGHFRYVECSSLDNHGAPAGDITPFADVYFPFDDWLRLPGTDLASIPVLRIAEGSMIEERYAMDRHGVVEVVITDLESGYQQIHCIQPCG